MFIFELLLLCCYRSVVKYVIRNLVHVHTSINLHLFVVIHIYSNIHQAIIQYTLRSKTKQPTIAIMLTTPQAITLFFLLSPLSLGPFLALPSFVGHGSISKCYLNTPTSGVRTVTCFSVTECSTFQFSGNE